MKRIAHKVIVTLQFDGLTLAETAALESFIEDGFDQNNEWGMPAIQISLEPTGVKEPKSDKKVMTAKKVLDLEKEHAGKEKK
jgi:hypothetical protein